MRRTRYLTYLGFPQAPLTPWFRRNDRHQSIGASAHVVNRRHNSTLVRNCAHQSRIEKVWGRKFAREANLEEVNSE